MVWHEIPYKNESEIEINVRVIQSPSWIALGPQLLRCRAGSRRDIAPGCVYGESGRAISRGRSPWNWAMEKSVTPKRFRCWDRSEPARLDGVARRRRRQQMPAGFLVSEWVAGSAQIGPGSHSILKVRWDAAQTSEGWSGGVIRLRLAQPVDGQTELTIPILQRFP